MTCKIIIRGDFICEALSIVHSPVVSGASSKVLNESMSTRMAAAVELLIFVIVYLIVSRSINAYLDE